jgi:hypothetical protein
MKEFIIIINCIFRLLGLLLQLVLLGGVLFVIWWFVAQLF